MNKRILMSVSLAIALFSVSASPIMQSSPRSSILMMPREPRSVLQPSRRQGRALKIHLELTGLTPGEHAIHFHQTPSCVAPDFKSAGGHFNPTGAHHGLKNPAGPTPETCLTSPSAPMARQKLTVANERVTLNPGLPTRSLQWRHCASHSRQGRRT